jgi:hypothetical protein
MKLVLKQKIEGVNKIMEKLDSIGMKLFVLAALK